MRIVLLGPVEVRDAAGDPVDLPGVRLRTLVARLAIDPDRSVTREALVDAVWGETPPGGAVNALQSLVARLRRLLPDPAAVRTRPSGYQLVAAGGVDLVEFDALVAPAHAGPDALRRGLALWRGEPFADLDTPPFAVGVAARLRELRLAAVERLVALNLDAAADVDLAELDALVAAHPGRERLRGLQLRALVAAGRPAQALASYADLRRWLGEELGTEPSPALRELHVRILQQESTVDLPRGTTPRGTVPRAPLTSFVGRESEQAALEQALARDRLVTVVGPGGAGKTRLATEVARASAGPVVLVELAGVREPSEVAPTVLAAVGLATTGLLSDATDAVTRVVTGLRDRDLLLVLDNCEHLLDPCAAVVDAVLAGCPRVRILVTTREPLGITGERLCPLGPLPVPDSTVDIDRAATVASVRLLLDRAGAVRPDLRLTPGTLAGVVEICRRLDGLPLALELAAARLRTLGVAEVAARLDDRFRLLTGGSRTALPRHRTLGAVLDWSWALFDDRERAVARPLAVFAGGAGLAAVEAVCGAGTEPALAGLVDKSFVVLTDEPPRYRMLDTIQAYAAAELARAGEADDARRAHARYYVALAEDAEPRLRGVDQLRWLTVIAAEYDNLVAALRWAVDSRETGLAVRLTAALGWFWLLRGATTEPRAWLREVLALPDLDQAPPAAVALAYAYDAAHQFSLHDVERASASAASARSVAGSEVAHPAVAIVSAVVRLTAYDITSALAELADLAEHPDGWTAAAGELIRGHAAETAGRALAARGHFAAARDRFTAVGDRWGTMMAVTSLSTMDSLAGDSPAALAALRTAAALAAEIGADDDLAWARARLGAELIRAGDHPAAAEQLVAARTVARARGSDAVVATTRLWSAELARVQGDLDTAHAELTTARLDMGERSGALPPRLVVLALIGLARVETTRGDLSAARAHIGEALERTQALGDRSTLALVAEVRAEVARREDRPDEAAHLLGLAVAIRGRSDLGSPDVRATETAAREALGDKVFERSYGSASTMDPDGAGTALDKLHHGQ